MGWRGWWHLDTDLKHVLFLMSMSLNKSFHQSACVCFCICYFQWFRMYAGMRRHTIWYKWEGKCTPKSVNFKRFCLYVSRCYFVEGCKDTNFCFCASVRLQYLSNCLCIRGRALWSVGCTRPQHSLRRVVSHHARLITDATSLLAAWQALPSASTLHASDNFISLIQPSV